MGFGSCAVQGDLTHVGRGRYSRMDGRSMAKRSAAKRKAGRGHVRRSALRALKAIASKAPRMVIESLAPTKAKDRVSYAKLIDEVEADKRPRRVPGRRVAVVAPPADGCDGDALQLVLDDVEQPVRVARAEPRCCTFPPPSASPPHRSPVLPYLLPLSIPSQRQTIPVPPPPSAKAAKWLTPSTLARPRPWRSLRAGDRR